VGDIAASFGAGNLVVLQPGFAGGPGVEVALGLQRWWASQIKRIGRPAYYFLLTVPNPNGRKRLLVFPEWSDERINDVVVDKLRCRWGLEFDYAPDGTQASMHTRLFEIGPDEQPFSIESWEHEGPAIEVPHHAFTVIVAVTRRLGAKLPFSNWTSAFGSNDAFAAMHFLRALGLQSLVEEQCDVTAPALLDALVTALEGAPAMDAAVELLPQVFTALREYEEITPLDLARAYRRARKAVGHTPEAWSGILDSLTVGGAADGS
jgi:hypothetical protein